MKESDIIASCKRQNRQGQEALFAAYADRLYRLASRYVKSTADAEDVLITALNKIYKNIGHFEYQGEGSLEAWLRKIVVNEALMWLRKQHNFNMTETIDDAFVQPDLTQLSTLEADDICSLISALPTGYRTVFNLVVVEGYSHKEISLMLSISENTSRSQLFKAKTLLKKMLTAEGFHYGT